MCCVKTKACDLEIQELSPQRSKKKKKITTSDPGDQKKTCLQRETEEVGGDNADRVSGRDRENTGCR